MEPWPAESTKRSRSVQWGLEGECLRWRLQSTWAAGAIPMGIPGWPELACRVASTASMRMVLTANWSAVSKGLDIQGSFVKRVEKPGEGLVKAAILLAMVDEKKGIGRIFSFPLPR